MRQSELQITRQTSSDLQAKMDLQILSLNETLKQTQEKLDQEKQFAVKAATLVKTLILQLHDLENQVG